MRQNATGVGAERTQPLDTLRSEVTTKDATQPSSSQLRLDDLVKGDTRWATALECTSTGTKDRLQEFSMRFYDMTA